MSNLLPPYKPGESGNPNGRPKITLDDLPHNWAELAIELYRNGASDVEIRADVFDGMSNDLWTRLMNDEPLFSETIKRGRILSESWWTQAGRKALTYDKFQNQVYSLHMQNRFGWSRKNETELTGKDGKDIIPPAQVEVNKNVVQSIIREVLAEI